MIVGNKPGRGRIGADALAKRAPDGYTLLPAGNRLFVNNPLRSKLPYPPGTIVVVSGISSAASIVVVSSQSGLRDLKGQLSAGQHQDGLLFATTGPGSTSHFVGAKLAQSGLSLTYVPYKGGSDSTMAFGTPQVVAPSDAPQAALPLLEAGKRIAIAVTSTKRFALLPDVPITAEQGLPEMRRLHWLGLFALRGGEPLRSERAMFTAFIQAEGQRLHKLDTDAHITLE